MLLLKKYCIAFEKVLAPSDLIVSIQLNMQCNSGINKSSKNFVNSVYNACCDLCDNNPVCCKYFQFLIMLVSVLGSDCVLPPYLYH